LDTDSVEQQKGLPFPGLAVGLPEKPAAIHGSGPFSKARLTQGLRWWLTEGYP